MEPGKKLRVVMILGASRKQTTSEAAQNISRPTLPCATHQLILVACDVEPLDYVSRHPF